MSYGNGRADNQNPSKVFQDRSIGTVFLPSTMYRDRGNPKKLKKHNAQAWLVNTGWSGGAYGIGNRIDLPITRRMLTAILEGELDNVNFTPDPNFKILVPESVPEVDSNILNPRNTWDDKDAYDTKAKELVKLFKNNFTQYESFGDYYRAGPD